MTGAEIIVEAARIWLWIGAGVAVLFLGFGMAMVDEDADGAFAFRPLLVPGILLIWPLVLWRWGRLAMGSDDWAWRYGPPRAIHMAMAVGLSLAILAFLLGGALVKQSWPADSAPQQLSAPEVSE
ncbi:MAG: hypothetical protein HRU31_06765 [Rhodobacteraceae bacterium]|nr:hypothetical protein [Paracoccaceae bacterium]